jgi:hypothetical protein
VFLRGYVTLVWVYAPKVVYALQACAAVGWDLCF